MSTETDFDDDDNALQSLYKLGSKASIFNDTTQEHGKLLPNQVVRLNNTERVLKALQQGHLVVATSKDQKRAKAHEEKAQQQLADTNAAAAVTAAAPRPASGSSATDIAQVIAETQKVAQGHITGALAESRIIVEKAKLDAQDQAADIKSKAEAEAKDIVKKATAEAAKITGEAKVSAATAGK